MGSAPREINMCPGIWWADAAPAQLGRAAHRPDNPSVSMSRLFILDMYCNHHFVSDMIKSLR